MKFIGFKAVTAAAAMAPLAVPLIRTAPWSPEAVPYAAHPAEQVSASTLETEHPLALAQSATHLPQEKANSLKVASRLNSVTTRRIDRISAEFRPILGEARYTASESLGLSDAHTAGGGQVHPLQSQALWGQASGSDKLGQREEPQHPTSRGK